VNTYDKGSNVKWRNGIMRSWIMLAAALLGNLALAVGPVCAEPSSAELLYSTYCIGCHTEQVHWRDKKLAADWTSLVAEVRRWQTNSGLNWTDRDIFAVARYLNELHYGYPAPN